MASTGRALGRLDVVGAQHEHLVLVGRVADVDAHEEAVDLRLGQGIGALEVDGVLRRQHHEGRGQLEAVALDGHLPLLHRLEQRGLGLGGRAVDFVGEHDVGEDGTRAQREGALLGREHVGAGDVGRQQVRRELDAPHRGAQRGGVGLDQRGLGDAGHALEQHVALGEQRGEHQVDRARRADVDAHHLAPQRVDPLLGGGDLVDGNGLGHPAVSLRAWGVRRARGLGGGRDARGRTRAAPQAARRGGLRGTARSARDARRAAGEDRGLHLLHHLEDLFQGRVRALVKRSRLASQASPSASGAGSAPQAEASRCSPS